MSVLLPNQRDLQKQLANVLEDSPILSGLNGEQCLELAQMAQIRSYRANDMVMQIGAPGGEFFFIIDGQARVIKEIQGQLKVVDHLRHHDLFGEQSLLKDKPRTATVEVMVDSKLAVFGQEAWLWLIGIPSVKANISRLESKYEKKVRQDFPGIHKDEVIIRMDKRHELAYVASLSGPLALILLGLLIAWPLNEFGLPGVWAIIFFAVIAIAWAVFNYLEWRNDDFIITTQRVIHVEKVILHGTMREESPLTAIQDINVVTHNWFTRHFDYHTLTIQTAGVGNIVFDGLRNTEKIKNTIFEQRQEAQQRVAASDTTAVRKSLAEAIGWDIGLPKSTAIPDNDSDNAALKRRQFPRFLNYFIPKIREQKGNEIVWRKHPFILLQKIAFPSLALIAIIYLIIAAFTGSFPFLAPADGIMLITLFVVLLLILTWFSYGYDDWKKDIYILTNTVIIDVDGSPFGLGREQRRQGTFDVVQNITYVSSNFITRLLNMGDVVIETAGTMDTFTFEQVYDYKGVQREISKRLFAFKEQVRKQKRDEEGERFTYWLGEYHAMSSEAGELVSKGQPLP